MEVSRDLREWRETVFARESQIIRRFSGSASVQYRHRKPDPYFRQLRRYAGRCSSKYR